MGPFHKATCFLERKIILRPLGQLSLSTPRYSANEDGPFRLENFKECVVQQHVCCYEEETFLFFAFSHYQKSIAAILRSKLT